MNKLVVVCLVIAGLAPILARSRGRPFPIQTEWGTCPSVRTVQNFSPKKYSGVWYDIQRYPNPLLRGKCGTAEYHWNKDRQRFNLTYVNQNLDSSVTLVPTDLSNGKFSVYFDRRSTPLQYKILDTDYVNYAVVWTCTDVMYGAGNTQSLNIFGRERHLTPEIEATALNVIRSNRLDTRSLVRVNQDSESCDDSDYDDSK